jgi:hypothetical protein
MAIRGSFAAKATEHLALVKEMCEATTRESLDAIQERVKDLTPVDTGELIASIVPTPVVAANDTYRGAVLSEIEHAAWVEYGTSPHVIRATNAQALRLADGRFFAKVDHPGYRGVHMFRRGGLEFAQMDAVRIARTNASKFLGTV